MRPPGRIPIRIGVAVNAGSSSSSSAQRLVPSSLFARRAAPPLQQQPRPQQRQWQWHDARSRLAVLTNRQLGSPCVRAFSTSRTSSTTASATAGNANANENNNSNSATPTERIQKSYFLSNGILDRAAGSFSHDPTSSSSSSSSSHPSSCTSNAELPHRRRQAARKQAKIAAAATAAAAEAAEATTANTTATELPENASTIWTDDAARSTSLRRVFSSLLALAKPRLTVLVVVTSTTAYALYPVPAFLSGEVLDAASTPSLSPLTLLFLTTGTALCSASANALNMLYEPDTDARMSRTRNRPLVRMLIGRKLALLFAVTCGVVGIAALHFGVNSTTAFLGGANIALYAGMYTPMKRLSVLNTWVGALVGGIPPLMGWAAAAGEAATGTSRGVPGTPGAPEHRESEFRELLFAPDGSSVGGWLLASLLFAWQFPHFMALSWTLRHEYQRAGLRMLSWVNPARNGRVALRYSLAFIPICVGLCAAGITEWSYAVTSLPVNLWLAREAVRFWRYEGLQGSARGLFWASVWHLPVMLVLALLQKKGIWARVWRSIAGEPDLEEEEYDDDEYEWEDEGPETGSATGQQAVLADSKTQS